MSSTKYRVNPAAVRAVRGEEGENHVEARLVLVPAAVGAPPDARSLLRHRRRRRQRLRHRYLREFARTINQLADNAGRVDGFLCWVPPISPSCIYGRVDPMRPNFSWCTYRVKPCHTSIS